MSAAGDMEHSAEEKGGRACLRGGALWLLAVLAVTVISVGVYAGTLEAGFVWDDRAAVMGSEDVRGGTPWAALLRHDFWGQALNVSYVLRARARWPPPRGCRAA